MATMPSEEPVPNYGEVRTRKEHRIPHYHHPYFLEALEEFDARLAERYNGHACIEYVDTYMHGFWGEGHTCALKRNQYL